MNKLQTQLHRIAILSDTHSLLRPEICAVLRSCEVILHAGDIASQKTYAEILAIAPAYFVQGNADEKWSTAMSPANEQAAAAGASENREVYLPKELELELFGFRFYMVHKKKDMRQDLGGVDVVICGHSHKYAEDRDGGILFLNPGSCGPRRFTQPITMAVMTVDEEKHTLSIERIDCKPNLKDGMEQLNLPAKDMDKLIRAIVKDMRANRTVDAIARRNKVSEDFVNQILQIYTTHPSIDVDGILNRMDIWGK